MSCDGRYADADEYAAFWCIDAPCASEEEAVINNVLDIAASDIHSALAAANACDCGLAGWATTYLKKLNIIDAVIYHFCHCANPHIGADMRRAYLEWIDRELELIRTGKKELCSGETGADFPAVDYAEMTWTDFNTARIIENEVKRNRA